MNTFNKAFEQISSKHENTKKKLQMVLTSVMVRNYKKNKIKRTY